MPHVYVHFLGDGRDTAPRSAAGYATELRDFIAKLGVGEVATVIGRYYAMDRDKRWERVKIAVEGLVDGKGEAAEDGDYVRAIEARYKKDETDEFLKPIIVNGDAGRIKGAFTPLPPDNIRLCADRWRYAVLIQLPLRPYARDKYSPWRTGQTDRREGA